MVDMSECVNSRLRVVIHIPQHTIDHTWCSSRGSNLTRIQHIQRQGIIGLVTATIGDRCACLQSQFLGSSLRNNTLLAECWNDISNKRTVKTIEVQQELSHVIVLEVPEHTFWQTAHRSIGCSWKAQCQIVTRQHHLIYFIIQVSLVLLNPCQFCCGEVTWRVQQVRQALIATQLLKSLLAIRNSTWITPDNWGTERLQVLVHANQSMHLIRDSDGCNLITLDATVCHNLLQRLLGVFPPRFGILFCPSGFDSHDRCFLFREESRGHTLAAFGVNQRCLDRRAAYIET